MPNFIIIGRTVAEIWRFNGIFSKMAAVRHLGFVIFNFLPVWGPIYKISSDNLMIYLTIMPKLRSTYDRRVIYKTFHKRRKAFSRTIHLQNRKIIRDNVRKLAYNIPKRTLSTLKVSTIKGS